ncbi:hypothetical protein ACLB2K_043606 [Fragaria x ananassa]
MIVFNDPEPKDVLARLKLSGVKIEVDEEHLMRFIESFLSRFLPCYWGSVIGEISNAIRRELVKSRKEIDVNLVRQVDEYFKKQGKKKDGSGDEWSDEDEPEDSDVGSEEEEEEESDSEDDMTEEAKPKEEEKKINHLKDDPTTRKRCMDRLSYLAREEKGMSVKQGEEEAILELMIPLLRRFSSSFNGIMFFLDRVSEYIERCCSRLDNLDTVEAALQSASFREYWKAKTQEEEEDMVVHANKDQPSKKNLVPTKEEGFATPVNQIKQEEKRESGDIMEVEETEISLMPLNMPAQPKESMGNAYSYIKESLERAGGNKRKLAQV